MEKSSYTEEQQVCCIFNMLFITWQAVYTLLPTQYILLPTQVFKLNPPVLSTRTLSLITASCACVGRGLSLQKDPRHL